MSSFDEVRFNQAFAETSKKFTIVKKVDSLQLLKEIITLINFRRNQGKVKPKVEYGKIFDEVLNQYSDYRNCPELKSAYKSLFGLYFNSFRVVNNPRKNIVKAVKQTLPSFGPKSQLKLF